ncbi:MAG: GNAT family N-acetyltransferase [Lachnospiraceae bacterium]|nr:GNAT family N-acetyltransferase [Lachnospiraceae bacterium]
MQLNTVQKNNLPKLKQLYLSSFPKNERKPFYLMQIWQKRGKMEIMEINNNNEFLGLVITVIFSDLVLIDYFAVCSNLRGSGIGTKAIELIRQRYMGKRIFLEIEKPNRAAPDNGNRLRRKSFYLNCGLKSCGIPVRLFGVDMELLAFDKPINFDEYIEVYKHLAGNMITSRIELLGTV